jgi:uncharacterized protein with von Willebrand factor type A (vWA) domain
MLSGATAGGGAPDEVLRARLAGFAGFLRANGFGVGGSESLRVLSTVAQTGAFEPQLLRWNLKALLCGRGDEWRRFDALFDAYFLPPNRTLFTASDAPAPGAGTAPGAGRDGGAGEPGAESGEAADAGVDGAARHGASRAEALASTDFRDLARADEARALEALLRRFARRLRRLRLRREVHGHRGRRLDLQTTIRRSVASGGTPLRLAWRERRRVRPRLLLLLDVSRSMSAYSFFYLRLARILCAVLTDVYCFIFHTRLTSVGEALSDPDPWRSQERLQLLAAGWAGGTRIGECLQDFNREHAPRLVHSRTAVIVVSDGYDTGEPERLAAALAALRRRARRVVWLNPLLGQPGFAPEGRAMRAALPHLDLFAPGGDLASIERVLPRLLEELR